MSETTHEHETTQRVEPVPGEGLEVQVQASTRVSPALVDYARTKVSTVLSHTREPALYAKVRISLATDPAVRRPARAQVNVDLNGRPLRVQVVAPTLHESVDRLEARLRDRLEHMERDWEARRGGRPLDEPHEWRHVSEPRRSEDFFPRPVEEREVVRHKAFALATSSVDEAAFDMDLLDYDFHLFTELETGQDAVLYRVPEGYRLALLEPVGGWAPAAAAPVSVSELPAPTLEVRGATERLEEADGRFVFFRNATTGRGNLVYRRYDGHYGLITPAD